VVETLPPKIIIFTPGFTVCDITTTLTNTEWLTHKWGKLGENYGGISMTKFSIQYGIDIKLSKMYMHQLKAEWQLADSTNGH